MNPIQDIWNRLRGRSASSAMTGVGDTGDVGVPAAAAQRSSGTLIAPAGTNPFAPESGVFPDAQLGAAATDTTEQGLRVTPENRLRYLYRWMYPDPSLRQAILDVRQMDRTDGRVKQIHSRVARDIVKGGLTLQMAVPSPRLQRQWDRFQRALQLNRMDKLKSDARGLLMEGNLPYQWVFDKDTMNIVGGVRMPSETIAPNVGVSGRFIDVNDAYHQIDMVTGTICARFALWQLLLVRFDPDNFDDMGCMGRPYLDAARTTWRKLAMTEEDLVIRRDQRAPLRFSHVLEGASDEDMKRYRADVESRGGEITTDFYLNRKGQVTALQGDANLDQIGDVVHLLDTFFSGSPLPKGLAGYTEGLNRDILEDLTTQYFDEVDVLQDTISFAYEQGFRLQLLLQGVNPDNFDFKVVFAERRTESPNQAADRGLKLQALGVPQDVIWEQVGLNAAYIKSRQAPSSADSNAPNGAATKGVAPPAPNAVQPTAPTGKPVVRIVEGGASKGESATAISSG
ncbi:hypothetical protein [Paraburkholderia adhaesiva]|uniref:hypothetical protein n=1 Tax=Paraburkholderia adhaesiva TaxID=2883244 RepID=UPI001F43EFF1|nr:hypothetical protein [Paraburkholderia adhaesiva]